MRCRPPVAAEGRVYADYDYTTYALNEATGSTVWSKPGGGAGLTYANGLLLGAITDPGGVDGYTAVVAATGEVQAVFPVRSGSFAPPIVADGTIYFGDNGITAYSLPAGLGGHPPSNDRLRSRRPSVNDRLRDGSICSGTRVRFPVAACAEKA